MLAKFSNRTLVRWFLWSTGQYPAATQTTQAERDCLAKYAAGKRHLAEIGVFNGVTTLVLRKAMASDAILWGIDPFPKGKLGFCLDERIARHEVAKSKNGTVEFVIAKGAEAAIKHRDASRPDIDFLFIDGDHSWAGIDADWQGWCPLVKSGGVIALHDSRSHSGRDVTLESARYTAEVIRKDERVEVIDEVDSVTVLRVK